MANCKASSICRVLLPHGILMQENLDMTITKLMGRAFYAFL